MIKLDRIHLDPIGGIAGDMFVAALCDAFPECVPGLMAEVAKVARDAGHPGRRDAAAVRDPVSPVIQLVPHADSALHGRRFVVDRAAGHAHATHREIRAQLETAGLEPAVLRHALGLFSLLAAAEGEIHGIAPEEVEFHEVGAFDSIVDFVAAAYLIATLAPGRWSFAPLPLGGGRVQTAHGVLPVPAPATALLLRGLDVIDDGVAGERVTPTGAAIARYLAAGPDPGQTRARPGPGPGQAPVSVVGTGHGFGTRRLPGMPNVLRVLAFTRSPQVPGPLDEEIAMLAFEIDDQTAEDLAVALDRIRAAPGVLDASQVAVYGKKNRLAMQVQVLARMEAADAVADLCLAETTTLGVRIGRAWRRSAARAIVETAVPETVRVKVAQRPTGELTAKAEIDDLAAIPGDRSRREQARRRAEAKALEQSKPYEPRDRSDD